MSSLYLEVGLVPMPGSRLGGFVWVPPAPSLTLVIAEVFVGSWSGGEPQMEILMESQEGKPASAYSTACQGQLEGRFIQQMPCGHLPCLWWSPVSAEALTGL